VVQRAIEVSQSRSGILTSVDKANVLETSRLWHQKVFDELTGGWSARDRRQFAGYLARLAAEVGA